LVERATPVREAEPARSGADVFVSYARADRGVVERLTRALEARGRTSWVDWEGIPPSAEWMHEISEAIAASDTVIFVLSPDSAGSSVCAEELDSAVAANKRILPVVVRDVVVDEVPHELAKRNWLFLRQGDDFDRGLDLLIETLDTDLDAVRSHTQLLVKARDWEQAGKTAARLLRGADLTDAERWISSPDRHLPPTELQSRFVSAYIRDRGARVARRRPSMPRPSRFVLPISADEPEPVDRAGRLLRPGPSHRPPNLRMKALGWLATEGRSALRHPWRVRGHGIHAVYAVASVGYLVVAGFMALVAYRAVLERWVATITSPAFAAVMAWILVIAVWGLLVAGVVGELAEARRRTRLTN
jgi:hypothetical protein